MKVSTFDSTLIRQYMENSSILQDGINYCKKINPGVSDATAKATAISLAQQYCHQKWQNDRTGYISNEYMAFVEFEKDVKAGRYFSYRSSYSSSRSSSSKPKIGLGKIILIGFVAFIAICYIWMMSQYFAQV